jgi:uncharacterized protein YdhG (YjbR/CyaY superfamily)
MADASGDRTKFFPAIEKKHGGPMSLWIDRIRDLGDAKYPEQIAYLRENHGFSQAHANALVMYLRDSPSSKRFATPDQCFAAMDPVAAATARSVFATIQAKFPALELVVAWNHPMLRTPEGAYVIGVSAAKHHVLLNPFSGDVLDACAKQLEGYERNKKTFKVPLDWKVDVKLLTALVKARLAELR